MITAIASSSEKNKVLDFRVLLICLLSLFSLSPNNLKSWEFGKEVARNFCSERATIAEGQGEIESRSPELALSEITAMIAEKKGGAYLLDPDHSHVLHWLANSSLTQCAEFLKFLKGSRVALCVGQVEIPPLLRRLLFGSECQFVFSPNPNKPGQLDEIERECLQKLPKDKGYKCIVVEMGAAGGVLANRLLEKLDPVFVFDFGGFAELLCGNPKNGGPSFDLPQLYKQLNISLRNPVKILYTSALIPRKFEERKREYIHSLDVLRSFGFLDRTYVVEAEPKLEGSFFDHYCDHVFYSGINDVTLKNRGVNEAKVLIEACKYYDIEDEDIIVKLTGRYYFENDRFLKFIESHPEIDAVVSYRNNRTQEGFQTGCFALRGKYFKAWLNEMNLERMEKELIDAEWAFTWFVEKMMAHGANVEVWKHLGVCANVSNDYIVHW